MKLYTHLLSFIITNISKYDPNNLPHIIREFANITHIPVRYSVGDIVQDTRLDDFDNLPLKRKPYLPLAGEFNAPSLRQCLSVAFKGRLLKCFRNYTELFLFVYCLCKFRSGVAFLSSFRKGKYCKKMFRN